jgi:predicted pyridoxine 5'-phosphate oxidase superfamily flavin-nucleotide-binding protein
MVNLPDEVKDILGKAAPKYTLVLGTASRDGIPNAVPVRFAKIIDDEHILIADNFFLKTRKNLEENPCVTVAFWDQETRNGYQVKGTATIATSGSLYDEAVSWVHSLRPKFKTRAAVVVKTDEVYNLKAGPDAGKKLV